MNNKAFEEWYKKEYCVPLEYLENRDGADIKEAFEAGQRQMNERCAEILEERKFKDTRQGKITLMMGVANKALNYAIKAIRKETKP